MSSQSSSTSRKRPRTEVVVHQNSPQGAIIGAEQEHKDNTFTTVEAKDNPRRMLPGELISCPKCLLKTGDADALLKHCDEYHPTRTLEFFCPLQLPSVWPFSTPTTCRAKFRTKEERRQHVEDSHDAWLGHWRVAGKYRGCCVPGCYVLNKPCAVDHFLRHLDETHNPECKPEYDCPICNTSSARPEGRRGHMTKWHGWHFAPKPRGPKPHDKNTKIAAAAGAAGRAASDSTSFDDSGLGYSSSQGSSYPMSAHDSSDVPSTSQQYPLTTPSDQSISQDLDSLGRQTPEDTHNSWLADLSPWNEYQVALRSGGPAGSESQGANRCEGNNAAPMSVPVTYGTFPGNALGTPYNQPYPTITPQQPNDHAQQNQSLAQIQIADGVPSIQGEVGTRVIHAAIFSAWKMINETSADPIPPGQEDLYGGYYIFVTIGHMVRMFGYPWPDFNPAS